MKYDILTYHIQFGRYHKSFIVRCKISFKLSSKLMLKNAFPKCLVKIPTEIWSRLRKLALLKFFDRKSLIARKSRDNFQYLRGTTRPEFLLQDIGKIDLNFLICSNMYF